MQRPNTKLLSFDRVPASVREVGALSPALSHILEEVKREVGFKACNEQCALTRPEVEGLIHKVAQRIGMELSSYERDEVLTWLERDEKPFGLLQDLIDDPAVTDIIVGDHQTITAQSGRENFRTDLAFPNAGAYEDFVERLLSRAGATYSTKCPIADGVVDGKVRVHAMHKCICEAGPYLTLRVNRFCSITVDDLVTLGTAPKEIFDYLCAAVASGKTLLFAGEVGTGKTTLVRAIAASVPEKESLLVIEDTPEIRLAHPHVRYVSTRPDNTDGAGRVSPSECIRAGMRMAMNRIIFGEIRDAEAAEAFIDVCASGHPGMSTIHARSAIDALSRLELFLGRAEKGVSRDVLSEQIAGAVGIVVFVSICKATRKRRVFEVLEIGAAADGVLRRRELFRYVLKNGVPYWDIVNKVSSFKAELEERNVVLTRMGSSVTLGTDVLYREAAFGGR